MLILLTLSLLPSGDHNSTSDLVSRAVNMGGELKKSFQILLNDTEAMEAAGLDVKNEKRLSNKPDKRYMKQIVRLLNERFSTSPNIRESRSPGNIPQSDDVFYNTPSIIYPLLRVSEKYKKRFNLIGVRSDVSKTTAPPTPVPLNVSDGKNAYYNTPPQARVVKHPRLPQKRKKDISKLNMPPKDLETTDVYYNTPPVVLGVDSNAILKKQYDVEKNITQRRKVPRYILRKYKSTVNASDKSPVSQTSGLRKRFHEPLRQESTFAPINILQGDESTVNISDKSPASQKSRLRKRFHGPLRQESTFAPINVLQGDEILLDVPQPVPATYDEQEESSEKEFSALPNIMRSSSLSPGDVLYGIVLTEQSTKDPQIEAYYQKMEANNIGYLSVAFEDLCEQLASKKQEHVMEIVKHTQFIVQELQNTGRLQWLGEPMTAILRDLSILLTADSADMLQVRAMILKSLMQQRRMIVGPDVNEVLDYADSLISKNYGEHLLTVIQDVKQYPNVNKNGSVLCKEIIEAFETPFLHLSGTKDLEYMVKNANKAFVDRFQQYSDLRVAKDHPGGGSSPTSLRPSLKQRMPQNIVHSLKVLTVTKSRRTTQAIKHQSRDKHPSKDKYPSKNKPPSIDKQLLKDERQLKEKHLLKDKRHAKHKHSSRHKHTSKKKHSSSYPLEGEEEHVLEDQSLLKHKHKRASKDTTPSKYKHLYTRKRSSQDATVLRRGHTYLKPGMLMG